MDKRLKSIYYMMIITGFILILICGWCTLEKTRDKEMQAKQPALQEQVSDELQRYFFDVGDMGIYGEDMAFFSHHQFVRVYADGEEIFQRTEDGGIWGRSPGSAWNFIRIPYGTNELQVEIEAAYSSVEKEEHVFYFGQELDMYKTILKESLVAMLVSMLLIALGIAMILYSVIVNLHVYVGKSLMYLGLFVSILGLWSFNETDAATLLLNHRITSSFSAFVFMMMMSASFLLFAREFMEIKEKVIWKVICYLSVIQFVVSILLQFFGIADLKETVSVTHVIMLASIFYVLLALLLQFIRKQFTPELKNNLLALAVLIAAALVDMIFYYIGVMDGDLFGRFIFLLFAVILGAGATSSTMKMLDRGKKAQIYEELAITDTLTHLYNRNCYEIDKKEMEKQESFLMVNFDLNDLKVCNDTYGHNEGDAYLRNAASIIEKIFSKYGKCYRVGGDEFQVWIKKGKSCPIQELICQLRTEEEKYNAKKEVFPIHIAVGYAFYDAKEDADVEQVCNRADEMMYENKRQYKEKEYKKAGV